MTEPEKVACPNPKVFRDHFRKTDLTKHNDIALHDVRGLRRGLSRIDDVQTLGDACFSQCRYITHWAMGPCDDLVEWLGVALARLEELAGGVELAWDDEADAWRRAGDR